MLRPEQVDGGRSVRGKGTQFTCSRFAASPSSIHGPRPAGRSPSAKPCTRSFARAAATYAGLSPPTQPDSVNAGSPRLAANDTLPHTHRLPHRVRFTAARSGCGHGSSCRQAALPEDGPPVSVGGGIARVTVRRPRGGAMGRLLPIFGYYYGKVIT